MSIIGQRFVSCWDQRNIYTCESYDPALGYWMQNIRNPEDRRNISERAIGRTYHRVRMTPGAWKHLALFEKLGRAPTMHELEHAEVLPKLTHRTLHDNDLVDDWGQITERGKQALLLPDHTNIWYLASDLSKSE